ncbi:MAG: hypothetical protein WD534_02190 [Phycisphaeraceae bacterium]
MSEPAPPPLTFPQPTDPKQASQPPRCRRCGYILEGLTEPRCPECGLAFNPADSSTYRRRPPFLLGLFLLPGAALALVGGLVWATAFYTMGTLGWGLVLGVPFAMGGLLGYAVKARWVVLGGLSLMVLAGLGMGLLALDLVGVYCGLILAGMFVVPGLMGVLLGWGLRTCLKFTRYSQRWYLPMWAMLLLPGLVHVAEQMAGLEPSHEVVVTRRVLAVGPAQAWESLLFYEDVEHAPSVLLRLGLPRPLQTQGQVQGVGDVKVCIYDKGHLSKRITVHEVGRRLAFDVTQQVGIEDNSVRLVRGSFDFEPAGAGRTQVTLSTEYQPLLTPRWYWRPLEQMSAHALHGHVLEGMSRRAGAEAGAGAEP